MSPHEFGFMAVKYGFEDASKFFNESIAGGQFGEQLVFIPRLIANRGRAEMMLVAYCTASLLFTVTRIVSGEVMETIMKGVADGINSIKLTSGENLPKQIQEHIYQEVINLVVAIDEGHNKITRASTIHLMKITLSGYAESDAELAEWEQWMAISVEGYEPVKALDELRYKIQHDCQARFVPAN